MINTVTGDYLNAYTPSKYNNLKFSIFGHDERISGYCMNNKSFYYNNCIIDNKGFSKELLLTLASITMNSVR